MNLEVVYFAWVRERIGLAKETLETNASTISELIDKLRSRDPRYESAFADTSAIRAAIDQTLVDLDAPLVGAKEVAFFPPMTGG